MIHFEGEQKFSRSLAEVSGKLGDASFLLSCLSNVEEILSATADQAVWKLRPGFSFVRGALEVTMNILERIPEASTRVQIVSKGIGASTTVLTDLRYEQVDEATTVRWLADITEITGLLKMVPKGLIQSAARKVIEETWTTIQEKLR